MSKIVPSKLFWIDLEMTGLDPKKDRIMDVGAIVTDFNFNELGTYEAVIKPPKKVLKRMKQSPWYDWSSGKREVQGTVYDMHKDNGLLEKIEAEGKTDAAVEKELIKLADKHFKKAIYLAGNSIHQDRRFIRKWWPEFEKKLHYRMLDVSSFKVYMQGKYKLKFHQPDSHRALDGIRGSIVEMKHYARMIQD